jgi:DNA polymerase III epsilon subunit-like protein
MKFYLDLEATRFSNRIISIGCAAGNGNTFETLVKPVNKAKVDNFITELTGITNEMLADAPSADEAFNQLFDFIELNSDGCAPQYFVYGNSDADFIAHTVKYMTDPRACICAQAIMGTLIDYATVVKDFFKVKSDLALRKVFMHVQSQTEYKQRHDALEDALMLQTVVEKLYKKCKPEDKDTILSMASQAKPILNKAPAVFTSWNEYSKWLAPTAKDNAPLVVKATDQHTGQTKYFDSLTTAALWTIKYIGKNMSPKNKEHISRIEKAILKSNDDNRCRYNCYWEYTPLGRDEKDA